MIGIGGNVKATFQTRTTRKNALKEQETVWTDADTLTGFLDLMTGGAEYRYNAKMQESTHIFIADYKPLKAGITAENSRLVIGGQVYEITLIDNPMGLLDESQWEIYLRYTGGQ
jgi:SPP1 family predicted phage head-tail adaptor